MKRLTAIAFAAVTAALLMPLTAAAAEQRGLSVAPLRQEVKLTIGKTSSGTFRVKNDTDRAMKVTFGAKEFSVADGSYQHVLRTPADNWVSVREKEAVLAPGQDKTVWYDVTVPKTAAPGGYYFTVLASTTTKRNGMNVTLQAGTLLYMTTDGQLTRTARITSGYVPFVVVGADVPWQMDVQHTGNAHFDLHAFGTVDEREDGAEYRLLPRTIRRISGQVAAPLLPGVYRLTYGYRSDTAPAQAQDAWFVYLPPWSLAAAAAVIVAAGTIWARRRTRG